MLNQKEEKEESFQELEANRPGRWSSATSTAPILSPASSQDLDDSYEAYKQSAEKEDISSGELRRVLRKVDLRLMPILLATYTLQYLDKNSINFASVYGLQKGTKLHGQNYSWLGSIFYFGYLLAQWPAGYAMQRLPIGKFLATSTLCWGIIQITTPACHNFAGIASNRFVLGLAEGTINPGFVLMMSMWYTTAEQPLRLLGYYCTLGVATMFGGLIGYAVGNIKSTTVARWQWVFLIFGAISILCGIVSLIFLPDLPSTAKFLSPRDRSTACYRVAANRQGVKNRHFKPYQLKQALLDPKTWLLLLMALGGSIPNSVTTTFTSIVISSFGFSTLGTQYMQIPGGAVQFFGVLGAGWICTHFAGRFHVRSATMITANTIAIIGSALLVGLPASNKWGRIAALWLVYFQAVGYSLSFTIMSSNIAGYTKKQVTSALYFTVYCVGNIASPQTFKESEKPGYKSAYIAYVHSSSPLPVVSIVLTTTHSVLSGHTLKLLGSIAIYIYMYNVNKRRDRLAKLSPGGIPTTGTTEKSEGGDGAARLSDEEREAIERGMRDVTELDNPGFRYVL
jgi:MFS family permease